MFSLLNKFVSFKEEWRLKSPKQKWSFVHNIAAKCSEIIGIRLFTDAKVTWLSFISLGIGIFYFPGISYTIWNSYNKGEFLLGMQCTCTLGMAVMVSGNCFEFQFYTKNSSWSDLPDKCSVLQVNWTRSSQNKQYCDIHGETLLQG